MNIKPLFLAAATVIAATASSHAATVVATNFTGEHSYVGGNNGLVQNDRITDAIPLANGVADLTTSASSTGSAGPGRVGKSEQTTSTQALFAQDGFFAQGQISGTSECLENNTTASCTPFLWSRQSLVFDLTVDVTSTLFLNGIFDAGDSGASGSIVDFLSISIQRFSLAGAPGARTNILSGTGPASNVLSGTFDTSIELNSGSVYEVQIAHGVGTGGEFEVDSGFFAIAGSIVEGNANVEDFGGRLDGALAPVPLPAGGWLLLAGIGAMGAMRRRARS